MRYTLYTLSLLLWASCVQRPQEQTDKVNSPVVPDTLHAGNFLLHFEDADSFALNDIYGDLQYRHELTDTMGNWHDRAVEIQNYLKDKFSGYFFTTDSTLLLKLANGNMESFVNWNSDLDEGYNFVHYFGNIDYFLLRVQWSEGNCWMLVNRKNGFKKYINGLPYISLDNRKILCINSDLDAGYSFNGLELYTILADSLQTEFIKETAWGPTDVKWINEHQFLLKREHFHIDTITGKQDNLIDYKRVSIEKKQSR